MNRSFRSFLLRICTPACALTLAVACTSSTASAQIGNIGGGNAAGGGAATTQGGEQAGNTTEGLGGRTTQGIGAAAEQGNQFTGGSIADLFVGGAAEGLFAGGGITTDRNSNRQFQALNSTSVPTGGTRISGTPRSIRTRLRVAFAVPATRSQVRPAGTSWPSMQQVASYRSNLSSVQVSIDAQGVATLTGMVADESSRRLAANLLRLRPGVRRLNNQLVVQQTELMPVLPNR